MVYASHIYGLVWWAFSFAYLFAYGPVKYLLKLFSPVLVTGPVIINRIDFQRQPISCDQFLRLSTKHITFGILLP